MKKNWHDDAWDDYLYWQTEDKKTLRRIIELLKSIDRNGYDCIGKLEKLSGNLSEYYSVRIDDKNRIVFRIIKDKNEIEIIQCGSHYKDH